MKSISNNEDLINYYNFNEDGSCITIGTKIGFSIITCNPFNIYHNRKFERGINIVELYHSSNIILLTGLEKNSQITSNKLIFWDDNKKEIIKEIRFSSTIRIIKIIQNKLFIINDIKLYIFNFKNLSLIDSFELYSNKIEKVSFSAYKNNTLIAYIKKSRNIIFIIDIEIHKEKKITINDNDLKYIYLQFNLKGNILLGACKGKIYLYNSINGDLIREISNEYLKNSNINCCSSFSPDDKFLAVSTIENNEARINIFDIGTKKEATFMSYFMTPEYECFTYHIIKCKDFIFRFYKDGIIIITKEGKFIKLKFDNIKGKLIEEKSKQIFN